MEENSNRIKYDLNKYLLRQQIVEHPFGTIKRLPIAIGRSMDHILLKGIKKNNGEFELIYFTYNFRRILNIFGYTELIKRLNKLFLFIYSPWRLAVVNSVKLFFTSYNGLPMV
jgi:hypothetical protein